MNEVPDSHFQTFYEFWRKAYCPKCDQINWIYDSHSQRHYPDIVDGVKCHSCSHLFWVGDKEEFQARYGLDLEECAIEEFLDERFSYRDGRDSPL